MIFSKMDAIRSLVGNDVSQPLGGDVIYHKGQTPPTEAEIDAEIKRLEDEWVSQEYARKRAQEYPELAEQFDLLWHAIDTGTLDNRDHRNKFYSILKKVKTDNPKG